MRTKLLNGTVGWDSLPWRDRLYYREGFSGGGAPDEHGEDAALSAPERVMLDDAGYEKALAMYAAAIGGAGVGDYLPDMNDLEPAPTSPAPAGAAELAVANTVMTRVPADAVGAYL